MDGVEVFREPGEPSISALLDLQAGKERMAFVEKFANESHDSESIFLLYPYPFSLVVKQARIPPLPEQWGHT